MLFRDLPKLYIGYYMV